MHTTMLPGSKMRRSGRARVVTPRSARTPSYKTMSGSSVRALSRISEANAT